MLPDNESIIKIILSLVNLLTENEKERVKSLLNQSDKDEYCEISGVKLDKKTPVY